ncbi:hypothetical protein KL930_005283 [Ogataea haglerorum]|uniref:CENP-T/Histone H4 histone fold domain-containing protein n=1 Tax=Ogataea haglerorum TaxID=1937702 RepID=A0AAN6D0T7_9ASCO|nr:hypothetical protein KL915_005313 [Ogataea haglerorum]KAG7691806.1 hypothetical protein KL951_005254 [Ogataea haglerorum]KAG7702201.1 hypothetical protein KL914_005332 [Ogataea haglerorum]KAG7702281.1 hypothetical protein KL950_005331 [Ogataea haglerorum]KAG7723848.1 hypothetical protein KL933_005323 [Ogataea haglerorum]
MSLNQSPSKFEDAIQVDNSHMSPSEHNEMGSSHEEPRGLHSSVQPSEGSKILNTPARVNSLSKVELSTITSLTEYEDASIVKTPRRTTQRPLRTPSRTPSRPNTPNRTPRKPTTPITLQAIADGATPRRHRLLLSLSKGKVNKGYSPRKDLQMLGRLLTLEKEDVRKKRKTQHEAEQSNALEILYAKLAPEPTGKAESGELSGELLSQSRDYLSTPDRSPRKGRLSSRLSLEASFGNSNVALPEAIIRKQGDFDIDSNEGIFASSNGNEPVLEDIDNFNIGGEYDAFSSDDSDDNDNLSGERPETEDLSLLNVHSQNKVPSFVTIRKRAKESQPGSGKQPVISLAMIRSLTRWLLTENDLKKLQSKEALIELQYISEEFFRQELNDLESYIEHANRRTVSYVDIKLLLHRARLGSSYDLFNFTDRATSIENDILNLSSQIFDLEITSEIEKLLYRDKIQRSKRIKRQLFKDKKEIRRRLEHNFQDERLGSSDSMSDLGEQEHMEKIERRTLGSPGPNRGISTTIHTLEVNSETDLANESQFDSHLYLRIENDGTSSENSLIIPLEEEDSEEQELEK